MQTRSATPDDYDDYARLHSELGVDDPVPSRERFTAELVATTVVADHASTIVGYARYDVMSDTGYIRNVVTDPAHRRRGIGRALMVAMRERFTTGGATQWCLNVKPGNVAAMTLYERCDMRPAFHSWSLRLAREVVLAPPPPELHFGPAPADADAAIEHALHLLPGHLANVRTRPSRQIMQLMREGAPVGVAVFSSTVPGAFPFRVTEPALGAALLAHVRTLAPPDAAYVQVGVEDDDPLRAALVELGARVHVEILHMRGAL